jgi:D-alanyl-D-alanine carboxypeptidase/D-alanyl-D-alanine-endopeptidase (penicillin-binding protein 4)
MSGFSFNGYFNPENLKPNDTLLRPFQTSSKQFVDLLSQATENKVEIDSLPFPKNQIQRVLYTHQEEKLYKALLQDSDNLIAESLLLMIGKTQNDTLNTKKTIDYLKTKWQDDFPDPLIWVDGSGVSRYNLLTPTVIVEALQRIYSILGWEKITSLFPAGGVSGTILEYYKEESTPYVFAKTGTLKNNISLSGFLIGKNNRIYVFSVMVSNHTSSNKSVREGIASLIRFFRKKY